MNICVFGDSIAKGIVFNEKMQKYTYLKDNFINITESRTGNFIKNFSRFGCTIKKGETILRKQLHNLTNYDYVLLEFGGNDCDLNWKEVSESPQMQHSAHVPLPEFRKTYENLITTVIESGSKPVLMTLPPLCSSKFFNWVSKGLNKEKILAYLGNDVNYIFNWHKKYNNMIYTVANEFNTPVIDIRNTFLACPQYENLLCVDGMHPNEKGHQLIADTLKSYI